MLPPALAFAESSGSVQPLSGTPTTESRVPSKSWCPQEEERPSLPMALSLFYLWMCCSFIFEECLLFITINEADNPLSVVFSVNLSKRNSESQNLKLSFTSNETFPRSSQNLFPWQLTDGIPWLFLTHYLQGKWQPPSYPYRSWGSAYAKAHGCMGRGEYLKKVMLRRRMKRDLPCGQHQCSRVRASITH